MRFRLRSLLALVTVAAIVLAIAGIYYRRQTPEAQSALVTYWLCVAGCWGMGVAYQWTAPGRVAAQSGDVRFVITSPAVNWRGMRSSRLGYWMRLALIVATWFVLLAFKSDQIVERVGRQNSMSYRLIQGIADGLLLTLFSLNFRVVPTYLCEHGVSTYGALAAWKHVRHGSWLPDRPAWLKLRRLDGDIYLEIPATDRAAVEAFVREKTTFKEAEAPAEREPAASPFAFGQ